MKASFDDLAEPFKSKVEAFYDKVQKDGLPFKLFESRRSFKRQSELFGKGRELVNGLMTITDKSKIVTKARAGESAHNWGLAADFILDLDHPYWAQWTEKPDGPWDDGQRHGGKAVKPCVINAWFKLGELAKLSDLEWGGAWKFKDLPHVEIKNWKSYRPENYQAVVRKEMMR